MSRRRGNRYENEFCAQAEALGYCAFPSRGSRGPVDIVCFVQQPAPLSSPNTAWYTHGLRPLAVQVGTTGKAISRTLDELEVAPRPIGSLIMVARRHRAANRRISWTYHTPTGNFTTLADAIAG